MENVQGRKYFRKIMHEEITMTHWAKCVNLGYKIGLENLSFPVTLSTLCICKR